MKIVILGGGAFGTAMANQLAYNKNNEIHILVRDGSISKEINEEHTNSKYYQNKRLHSSIKATTTPTVLSDSQIILIATPSKAIPDLIDILKANAPGNALIVNMAKGIFDQGTTIVAYLKSKLSGFQIISLKGASFSAEMINRIPTLLTLGFEKTEQLACLNEIIKDTNIFLDYTTDIKGVELLSALKNIYAIILGIIDAKFNSANTRFLIFTKAINEIKIILKALGGKEETIFLSCGIGDISLTSLNDLSRNRTLGLLIGKGFYNSSFTENSVVLEGLKTLRLIDSVLSSDLRNRLPLFTELSSLLLTSDKKSPNFNFDKLFRKNFTTVLTYGTFDLIHYGHLEILRRAKSLGDYLIVGLSTDQFNAQKGKVCEMTYEKRKEYLESIEYVDLVIPEESWDQKTQDVQSHNVDIFIMGDDWSGQFDFLNKYCEVKYLPRTKGVSTTALKTILKKN